MFPWEFSLAKLSQSCVYDKHSNICQKTASLTYTLVSHLPEIWGWEGCVSTKSLKDYLVRKEENRPSYWEKAEEWGHTQVLLGLERDRKSLGTCHVSQVRKVGSTVWDSYGQSNQVSMVQWGRITHGDKGFCSSSFPGTGFRVTVR